MKHTTYIPLFLAATLSLLACADRSNDSADTDDTTADPPETTSSPPNPTTPPTPTTDDTPPNPTTVDPPTSSTTPVDPTTSGDPVTTSTTDPVPPTGFDFRQDPHDAYTQVDRHGAPEAGTLGIRGSGGLGLNGEDIAIRDSYNASNPAEDAAATWIPEIALSFMFFHDALADDLMDLGLEPATLDDSIAQLGPVLVPDVLKYDSSQPNAYPNGRTLTDPVVDITLAALLMKLGPTQPLDLFATIPLNPPTNDLPFAIDWPFLAPPHAP